MLNVSSSNVDIVLSIIVSNLILLFFKHVMYQPNLSFISFSNQFGVWTPLIGKVLHHETLVIACSRNSLYIVESPDATHLSIKLNKYDKH